MKISYKLLTTKFTLLLTLALVMVSLLPIIAKGTTDFYLTNEEINSETTQKLAISENTNICDGVTCPDGSCAPTQDECMAEATINPDIYSDHEELELERSPTRQVEAVEAVDQIIAPDMQIDREPDFLDNDSDGNGILERSSDHNTPRPNETEGRYVDPDTDQDETQMEWRVRTGENDEAVLDIDTADVQPAQDYNSSRSNKRGEVSDDITLDETDESDVIRPAKNYNSTRSNRRKNSFFDPTGDDAEEEDEEANVATVSAERLASIKNTPPTVRCGSIATRADDTGTLWCWGSGVRAIALGEENEDSSLATSSRVLRHLSVSGNEVRAWSEQEQAEFRQYRQLINERNTPEALLTDITNIVLTNDRVRTLEVNEQETRLTYQARMRLFGLIPMEREVSAKASEVKNVNIDYPWYGFLSRKPDTPAIKEVFTSVSSNIASRGGGSGKVSLSDFR